MQQGRKYSPKSCLFAIYLNSWLQGSKLLFDTTSRRSIRFPEYQLCTETPTFRNIKSFSNAFADHRVKVLEVAAQALVAKCCPSNILLSIELVQKSPVFQKGALRLKSQYRGLRVLKQKNSRADWNRLTWFMPFECSYQSGYLAMRSWRGGGRALTALESSKKRTCVARWLVIYFLVCNFGGSLTYSTIGGTKTLDLALVLCKDRRGKCLSRFFHANIPQFFMLSSEEDDCTAGLDIERRRGVLDGVIDTH
jgi:hypothetical protein